MKLKDFSSIFVTGARKGNYSTKMVNSELSKFLKDSDTKFEGYVITGNLRYVEQKIVAASKQHKLRVVIVPANFDMYSGASAEQMRNADVIDTFKPEVLMLFGTDKQIEEDSVLAHLKTLAIKKNIRLVRIGK